MEAQRFAERDMAIGRVRWMWASAWSFLPVGLLAAGVATADVYTWVDAHGSVNVSNLAPPAGARVTSVAHESADAIARAEAARKAAQDAEVQALADRVADLERAAEQSNRMPPPVFIGGPPPGYGAPPPPQYTVTTLPETTADDTGPSYAAGCAYVGCPLPIFAAPVVIVSSGSGHRSRATRRPHGVASPVAPGHGTRPMPAPHPMTRVVMPQQAAVRAGRG
jgi:hypothetical protein